MMTKIEELKAAYEAATPGEWDYVVATGAPEPNSMVVDGDGEYLLRHRRGVTLRAKYDVAFIALAHNLMPQLLEAVEVLKEVGDVRDMAELMNLWDHKIEPVLEKLK